MNPARRVRKIIQRARSANPHEAASALAIARALMEKHGLREDEVAEDVVVDTGDESDPNRAELAVAVAAKIGCAAVGGATVAFRGHGDLAHRAKSLYLALAHQADAMSAIPVSYDLPKTAAAAWRHCFWIGFVAAVGQRLVPPKDVAPAPGVESAEPSRAEEAAKAAMEAIDILSVDMASFMAPVDVQYILLWLKKRGTAAGRHVGLNVPVEQPGEVRGLLTTRLI